MEKDLRNTLRNVVTQCRKQLEQAITETLQGQFGIHPTGEVEAAARLAHLSAEDRSYRDRIVIHLNHIQSAGLKPKDAIAQLVREAAFTHLNRLCAYKLMATRGLIDDPVGKVLKSRGFLFYLADHPEDERLHSGGEMAGGGQARAYRHYLEWLNGTLSRELEALFSAQDLASGLFPPHRVLESVLALLNSEELKEIWTEDETIGWVYQYFTPKELRDKARKESAAPRNSYELAFRNQFFTPRYVVEFLTDNTLGRTWYEMRKGETALAASCRYLVRRPNEVFLAPGEQADRYGTGSVSDRVDDSNFTKEELLKQPVHIPHREKKDPREIKVLDPACGSGHFLLYCFDLFQTIYEEAYEDAELGARLKSDYPDAAEFRRNIPALILAHNLHGIDIDLRATQIAALALWLRAQRAWHEINLKREERPRITRLHVVCAEPMPGEPELLDEFVAELQPRLLGQLVRMVFEKMKLAGEAGSLLRIEDEISEPIAQAKKEWQTQPEPEQWSLFDDARTKVRQQSLFDVRSVTDAQFWDDAEAKVIDALREYASRAANGQGILRRLFADDALQGFAFVDLCRQKFDVVLMNPPFGEASLPSKPYIDAVYGDTKGDVYKAFVECFQDRLVSGGFLGIISSRTGFFLSGSSDWRERVVLRLYRPLVLADFGMGVLDAMVETAAYVLRSLTEEEDRRLTLQLVPELERLPTNKKDIFSTKKYEEIRELKRHQANSELRRLHQAGFIMPVEGRFPRWLLQREVVKRVQVPHSAPYPPLICLRLLGEEDKGGALQKLLTDINDHRLFVVEPESLRYVPNTPFCYWVPNKVRQLFITHEKVENVGREVRIGPSTGDDARYIRLGWEVPPTQIGRGIRWVWLNKGGAASPFYFDYHLVIDWDENRRTFRGFTGRPGRPIERPNGLEHFFRPGISWPLRTQAGFNTRIMPMGLIFSHKGPTLFASSQKELFISLALTRSRIFQLMIELQISFGSYEVGAIQRAVFPQHDEAADHIFTELALRGWRTKCRLESCSETSSAFVLTALQHSNGITLNECIAAWQGCISKAEQQLDALQREIDDIAFHLYGISGEDREAVEVALDGQLSAISEEGSEDTDEDEAEAEQPFIDHRSLTTDLISYIIGCVFGRWDVCFATGEKPAPELPNPFAPLPACAPGALQGEDGLPVSTTPPGYPLRVDWDGILVDDPDHGDDIIRRVRDVFELIWKDRAEAIEREACELLGVRELRDYFRRPGVGGFWTDQVKRYSKSRRKAPIYWLLQSSKKNYGLWLYYHRLGKDMLFKALLNYVEPKLRLEENKLDQLRAQRTSVGAAGREAKQIEKQLVWQEALMSELRDFHDKLERAAKLGLEPDLNDGVVLNIAPLWELVPWAEAKKYWEELKDGKYEWSSIGKQMREKGLVK